MNSWDILTVVAALIAVIMQSVAWYGCSTRGGEFVRAPFEIGYRCTK